jgi:hypothetical protein
MLKKSPTPPRPDAKLAVEPTKNGVAIKIALFGKKP